MDMERKMLVTDAINVFNQRVINPRGLKFTQNKIFPKTGRLYSPHEEFARQPETSRSEDRHREIVNILISRLPPSKPIYDYLNVKMEERGQNKTVVDFALKFMASFTKRNMLSRWLIYAVSGWLGT